MAIGNLGAVIESQVMSLADDGNNEAGNFLFKMSAGIYMLVYRGVTLSDMRFATFAIDETTGAVTGTPIDEFDIGFAYSSFDHLNGVVTQLPGTRIIVCGADSGGGSITVRTVTCDADGTNISQPGAQGFSGWSTGIIPLFVNLNPNVVAIVGAGGSASIGTISISDTGVINATPIQAVTSLGISSVVGFAHVRDTIGVVVDTSGSLTVSTFTLNLDGTFSTSLLDGPDALWSRTVSASQLNTISSDDGTMEWSGWSQNSSNRIERYMRVTVSALGVISSALNLESQLAAVNKFRPTTYTIGQGVYAFLQEGSNVINTVDTLGLGVSDTLAVSVTAGTKGVGFVTVSTLIGAMVHIGTTIAGVVQYVTTFNLESPAPPSIAESSCGRLEIDNYVPRFGGTAINISLDLCYTRWQETIDTKAMILPTASFRVDALSLNTINMVIEVKGSIYRSHPVHPVVTDVLHIPDVIDLEEAAILWNKDAPKTRARLILPLVSGERSYEGVISRLSLIDNPGTSKQDFILTFTVAWNTSVPTLREWN